MKKLETNNLIEPMLLKMEKECDELKDFIKTRDFPYHKSYYFDRIVKHASALLLLAGEVKAIHSLQDYDISENEYTPTEEELIKRLNNCEIF